MSIVLVSILCLILLSDMNIYLGDVTMAELEADMAAQNVTEKVLYAQAQAHTHPALLLIEKITIGVMTLDLLIRFIMCRHRTQLLTVFTFIDFMSILPPYIHAAYLYAARVADSDYNSNLRIIGNVIAAFRIFRVFRLLKLVREIHVLQVLVMSVSCS